MSRRVALRAAAVLALALLACGRPQPPSVVIVLVDQLRKDAADRWMAGLRAAARRGIVVEEMRAAAPWTYPSVVSLMSGLYPQQHGADGHLRDDLLSRIEPGVPLLQRRLGAAGYTTAAFVANPFLLEWNAFHEGFDHFDGSFVRSQGNRRGDESVWVPGTMFSDTVNDAVRRHYEGSPADGPEFTYVHYIDVHGPWRGAPFRPEYEAAVRYVDRKIMELYDFFTRRYDGRMLFVATSDHGRSLDDDRQVGFGRRWRRNKHSVHDYNLRIPFAILPSALVREAVRVEGPASNVDVVPTLLDWLGLEPTAPLPGRSLLPAIRGEAELPRDRPVYARNSAFRALNDGVVYGGRKYVRFFDPGTGEVVARRVFDLVEDPRETRSLGDDFGSAAAVVERAAGDHGLAFDAVFEGIDEDVRERLRALGYLDGEEPGP